MTGNGDQPEPMSVLGDNSPVQTEVSALPPPSPVPVPSTSDAVQTVVTDSSVETVLTNVIASNAMTGNGDQPEPTSELGENSPAQTEVSALPPVLVPSTSDAIQTVVMDSAVETSAPVCHASSSSEIVKFENFLKTLSTLPKARSERQRKRKTESAAILTASPYKKMLLEKNEGLSRKLEKKRQQSEKKKENQGKSGEKKRDQAGRGKKTKGRKGETGKGRGAKTAKGDNRCQNDEKWTCQICKVVWGSADDSKSDEDWYPCVSCNSKYHESCAWEYGIIDDDEHFTCKDCL